MTRMTMLLLLMTLSLHVCSISALTPTSTTPNIPTLSDDPIFRTIEQHHGKDRSFQDLLDAGTGMYSLRWLLSLMETQKVSSITAVTAEGLMRDRIQEQLDQIQLSQNDCSGDSTNGAVATPSPMAVVVLGNWFGSNQDKEDNDDDDDDDENLTFLPKKQYDTILAEYLIGAIDGFSPYRQQDMIPKLVKLLKPGGRLYLVGWEPMPITADHHDHDDDGDNNHNNNNNDDPADLICKIQRIKDACILMAGQRTYREYPLSWVLSQVERIPNVSMPHEVRIFAIQYQHQKIVSLINAGRSAVARFSSPELATAMNNVLDDLERQSKEATDNSPSGTIEQGFDYLVTIEKDL